MRKKTKLDKDTLEVLHDSVYGYLEYYLPYVERRTEDCSKLINLLITLNTAAIGLSILLLEKGNIIADSSLHWSWCLGALSLVCGLLCLLSGQGAYICIGGAQIFKGKNSTELKEDEQFWKGLLKGVQDGVARIKLMYLFQNGALTLFLVSVFHLLRFALQSKI